MSALSDPISDYLTRLRNASRTLKPELMIPYSKIKADISRILREEGYISDYEVDKTGNHPQIRIVNKIVNRTAAITNLRRISRPGLRKYVGAGEIPRVLGGLGISILSTSSGVLSGREAKKKNVGGELLAFVW